MIDLNLINHIYLKIPYKFNGRAFDGVDCWGLVILFYKYHLNKKVIDLENKAENLESYSKDNFFIENYHKQWEKVINLKEYDLIFFKNSSNIVNHCGIYLSNNIFMQATSKHGITFCKINSLWKSKIQGFYRLKDNDKN